jgi:neutral ceramidase
MRPSCSNVIACIVAATLIAGFALANGRAAELESLLKAGFAERDITPEQGMECPGGYTKRFHRGLHDPCKVRAAVFDDGSRRVALVGVDALAVRRPLVEAVRKAVHARCGIAPEAILIGASHSHSSGPTCMVLPGEYDHGSPLVKSLAYEKSSCADPKYLAQVEKQLVEAICAADQSRVEAQCGVGKGIEDRVAFNRRLRMKNGMTFTHPGQLNPDIVEPAGPIDPEVGVIGAWNAQGKCIGCVVNYSCHATCNPGGISANWIYYMEQTIRGAMGNDCVVVFLQGACGDVTQVDNLSRDVNPAPEDWCRLVGGRVGAEAVKVLLSMARGPLGPIDLKQKTLAIKRRVPSPEHLKKALELARQPIGKRASADWIFAKETVLLDAKLAKEPVAQVEVQAIQVGPAVFVANPAEFFVQLGLDIKAKSPFKFTFPVEMANDCVGYVPTEEAFGLRGGGYETRLTSYSNLEITAGPRIVEAGLELARRMKPGVAPQHRKAPAFHGKPWDYGNLPPERD